MKLTTCRLALLVLPLLLAFAGTAWAGEPYWIDVRTAEEYAAGHVDGAVNIPHTEIVGRIGEVTTDKDAPIYLYCRSGRRSGIAQAALEQAGYSQVTNLGGLQDAQVAATRLAACANDPTADC